MPGQDIRTVEKKSFIAYKGKLDRLPVPEEHPPAPAGRVHRVPARPLLRAVGRRAAQGEGARGELQGDALRALRPRHRASGFSSRTTRSSTRATSSLLDKDAMGRFFPHADLTDIIRNMRVADNATYNATFTYPEGGRHRVREGARERGAAERHRARREARVDRPAAPRGDDDRARDRASSASSRARPSTGSRR